MTTVEAVLPDEQFVDRALEWVTAIAAKPRAALVAAKRAVVEGLRLPFDEGLRLEGRLFLECQTGDDASGIAARVTRLQEMQCPRSPSTTS